MPKTKRRQSMHDVQVIRHGNEAVAVLIDIDDYEDLLDELSPRTQKELAEAQRDIDLGRTISQVELFKQLGL